jgi:hypothetical protein
VVESFRWEAAESRTPCSNEPRTRRPLRNLQAQWDEGVISNPRSWNWELESRRQERVGTRRGEGKKEKKKKRKKKRVVTQRGAITKESQAGRQDESHGPGTGNPAMDKKKKNGANVSDDHDGKSERDSRLVPTHTVSGDGDRARTSTSASSDKDSSKAHSHAPEDANKQGPQKKRRKVTHGTALAS